MSTTEIPPGGSLSDPAHPKSPWSSHLLRNFDLKVIIEISGCERSASRLLRGEPLSGVDVGPLAMANHAAGHMGYLPLFELGGKAPSVAPGVEDVLRKVLPNALFPRGGRA
ncbi:hypothetical protein [Paenarthrobacter sp. Y-19]|uniref:hypothetical protein n=1 Tax=Paenarthrobacter sp. Y-19 TaxID=3031125 RepID=UPI0023DA12FE|nr:hypothetical protein [Paenarthrobacter sp. Y-19]